MQFSIDPSVRIDILTKSLKSREEVLYHALALHGYDPENFNEDTFLPKDDNIDDQTIAKCLANVQSIKSSIQTLENE